MDRDGINESGDDEQKNSREIRKCTSKKELTIDNEMNIALFRVYLSVLTTKRWSLHMNVC